MSSTPFCLGLAIKVLAFGPIPGCFFGGEMPSMACVPFIVPFRPLRGDNFGGGGDRGEYLVGECALFLVMAGCVNDLDIIVILGKLLILRSLAVGV